MVNVNAYKEGSPEWYKQLLDFLSRSTYDAIVQRQSEDKIMGQLNDSYQLLLNLRSDFSFRKNEPIRKSAMKRRVDVSTVIFSIWRRIVTQRRDSMSRDGRNSFSLNLCRTWRS